MVPLKGLAPHRYAIRQARCQLHGWRLPRSIAHILVQLSPEPKPTGNWIDQFRDFRDIHDVIAPLSATLCPASLPKNAQTISPPPDMKQSDRVLL